ncbi:MAG: copper chaperone CopZ [Firmicutes bacterium]|nr:copper chaperone CopZ [Bacillota bacterium]
MPQQVVLEVEGMTCNHCVNSVKNAVGALAGVEKVAVDLKAKKVTVNFQAEAVTVETIKEAIEDQGYEVK